RGHVVGDFVGGSLGVGHLEVDDGVDGDDQVVLGDDGLWRAADYLLPQVDVGPQPVDERRDEVEPRVQRPLIAPEAPDDARLRRGDDPVRAHHGENGEGYDQDEEDYGDDSAHNGHLRSRELQLHATPVPRYVPGRSLSVAGYRAAHADQRERRYSI